MAAPLGPAGRGRGSAMALVIYDSQIQAMNNGNGIVGSWIKGKTRQIMATAAAECPKRTGALAGSIAGETRTPSGANRSEGEVRVGGPWAWYALCVLRGTHGPNIYAKTAPAMWVPESRGSERRVWMSEVNGQEANDFLGRALASVMEGRLGVRFSGAVPFGPPL